MQTRVHPNREPADIPLVRPAQRRDPGRTRRRIARDNSKGFDAAAFYRALSEVVRARKVAWRQVSRDTGVTTSTLSRMAWGRGPDAAGLAVLSAWAGINPAEFVDRPGLLDDRSAQPGASSPDLVVRLLRSDSNLEPEMAVALGEVIRIAYRRSRKSP